MNQDDDIPDLIPILVPIKNKNDDEDTLPPPPPPPLKR